MKLNTQIKTALSVFALLGLLIGAISWLRPISAAHRQQGITLSDRAASTLAEVSVTNSYGSYTVTLEDGTYLCEQLRQLPVSIEALDDFAERCTSLHAQTQVRQPEDESIFGLTKPKATVQISFVDETELRFVLGTRVENSTDYYLQLAEGGPVYTVEEAAVHYFLSDVSSFVDLTLTENLTESAALPDRLEFSTPAVSFALEPLEAPVRDGVGNSYSYLLRTGEESCFADSAACESYFGRLHELRASSVVQLFPSPEELASYGLAADAPATAHLIFTFGEQTTELLVGNRSDEDYYVYKPGVGAIFTLPLIQTPWDGVSLFALMGRYPAAPPLAEVASIEVQTTEGSYQIEIDGKTAVCNGISLSDRTFGALYALLCSCRAEYELTDPVEPILPELTIVYTLHPAEESAEPRTLTLRLIPYGLRRHAIEVDGVARYGVRSTYVTKVTEVLLSLRDGIEITPGY